MYASSLNKKTSQFIYLLMPFLFLTSISTDILAQKILALDKGGRQKRIRYFQNDFISLKTKDRQFIEGEISQLGDSSFWVGSQEVALNQVHYIKKTKGGYGWSILGNISLLAGLGYFSLDATNRLINNDNPIAPRRTIVSSSIFMGIFATTVLINNRKYRINKRRRLHIIDIEISPK